MGPLAPTCAVKVFRRRWLFFGGPDLYSRPYVDLHPRTKDSVYSRPCGECRLAQKKNFGSLTVTT